MKTNDQNAAPMASALPAQASAAQRATLDFYERLGGYALTDIGTDADGLLIVIEHDEGGIQIEIDALGCTYCWDPAGFEGITGA